jgi:hypothetical protein
MITFALDFFGAYLIEFMTTLLVTALILRWVSFRHSKKDEVYFSHFTRELSSTIEEDKGKGVTHRENIESYLNNLLGRVHQKLPERNLRRDLRGRTGKAPSDQPEVSLRDYLGSKHGMIVSIQNESNVFNSNVSPDFSQLTERVMNDDEHWSKLFRFIPIDGIVRTLDILPTLFIILGVFGTFIGISMALPEIAKIDFNNLETSGATLSNFVISVTYAMKTSIAGIFYSIILTLLNTIFPIDATREKTFESVENALQTLWYHLQTDHKQSQSQLHFAKIGETLEKILGVLENRVPESTTTKKAS